MLQDGVGFTVYRQEEGIERVWPMDPVPRIIPASEWEQIERPRRPSSRSTYSSRTSTATSSSSGIASSTRAPHLGGRLLAPRVHGRQGAARRLHPRLRDRPDPATWAAATSSSRTTTRTPSGVSYMLTNRQVLKHVWPQVFEQYDVRSNDDYPSALLDVLRYIAPGGNPDPTVVLLSPGMYNSAYLLEHTFLARQMGVELVEGRDLVVDQNRIFMRTTRGLERVDVIYRRIDDDYLDPLVFRPDSMLGVPGVVSALPAPGSVAAGERHRHRHRRRQGHLPVRAGHDPLLPQAGSDPAQRRDVPPARQVAPRPHPRQHRRPGRQDGQRVGRLRHARSAPPSTDAPNRTSSAPWSAPSRATSSPNR